MLTKLLFIVLVAPGVITARTSIDCFKNKSKNCKTTDLRVVPQTVSEFLSLRKKLAKEPYGAAELILLALLARQENPIEGNKMLILAVSEDQVIKTKQGLYKGYNLRSSPKYFIKQIDKHPYCINAHVSGTSPINKYRSGKKVQFIFRKQTKYVPNIKTGKYKVFACSSATDSCRPMALRKNKHGIWKVSGFSSIAVGCKKPISTSHSAEDDL